MMQKFTCDNPNINLNQCVNQDVVDKACRFLQLTIQNATHLPTQLAELMELHKAMVGYEEKWRVFSYSKGLFANHTQPSRFDVCGKLSVP